MRVIFSDSNCDGAMCVAEVSYAEWWPNCEDVGNRDALSLVTVAEFDDTSNIYVVGITEAQAKFLMRTLYEDGRLDLLNYTVLVDGK